MRRSVVFALVLLACAAGAAVYVARVARREVGAGATRTPLPPWSGALPAAAPLVLFRSTALAAFGVLALAPLDALDARRGVASLSCERVDYAAGRGLCLAADRGVVTAYAAIVFDDSFRPLFRLPLSGSPSRVRVSPDGRLAATTIFVQGHSYAGADFSTLTSIVDLQRGDYVVTDLEQLEVADGGEAITAADRNFWGVTFAADSDRFFATVASGGRNLLIEGRVGERRAKTIGVAGECPSLSPDGRRLAFKRRTQSGIGPVRWRLVVLDLAGRDEVSLPETRSVDDQVEWLDDGHILYSLPAAEGGSAETNTWIVAAAGSEPPELFLRDAYSAVVLR